MPFSRRLQEEREQRAEERRQAEIQRRQEEELLRQKEKERREQARQEARQRDAALEAAREQRETLIAQLRLQRRSEQQAAARDNEKRRMRFDQIVAAARKLNIAQAEERSRLETERAARAEQGQKERLAQQQQTERQKDQRQSSRQSERTAAQRQAEREAATQSRLQEREREQQEADQRQEELLAAQRARQQQRQAALDADEQRQINQAAIRQARLDERERAREEDEKRQASLHTASQAHSEQNRQTGQEVAKRKSAQDTARQMARQENARQDHLSARRQTERQAEQQTTRRADALQQRRDEMRQAEQEQARIANRRDEANQARQAEQRQDRQSNTPPIRPAERRSPERAAKQAPARKTAQRPSLAQDPAPHDPFQDPIPSGVLSGALPWLRCSGNRVTNIFGEPILLRGVNLLGMDGAEPHPERGFRAGAGISPETIDEALAWGANLFRVAINRSRALQGSTHWSPWDYLEELDALIQQAARGGAYTLLSLRRLDETSVFGAQVEENGERLPNYIAPMPDYDSIGLWRVLGERYAAEPAVLFDLYTAPHPPLADDLSGLTSDWDLWTLWVQMIVADLRRLHPRALIFVSGLDGGVDLSGFPVRGTAGDPIPNLVYTAHLYPRKPNPVSAIQTLIRSHPVFVSEWGGEREDVTWASRTELLLRGIGAGWAAAHWNAGPQLVQVVNGRSSPTPFGRVVQRALALAGASPETNPASLLSGLVNF